jgi:hypothetical protein
MEGLESWVDFNVALGAASAALAGLIMVAMSVNIKQVISFPGISARAAAALALLVLVLVCSLIALIPSQSPTVDGVMTLLGCVFAWIISLHAVRVMIVQNRVRTENGPSALPPIPRMVGNLFLYLAPLGCLTLGGALLTLGSAGGAYWVALGSIGALAGAVLFSWVALVEVLR